MLNFVPILVNRIGLSVCATVVYRDQALTILSVSYEPTVFVIIVTAVE